MSDTSLEDKTTRYLRDKRRRRDDGHVEMRVLQETLECPSTEEIEAAKSAATLTCAVGEGARCAFCRLSFRDYVDATSIIRTGFCESCLNLLEFGIDHSLA